MPWRKAVLALFVGAVTLFGSAPAALAEDVAPPPQPASGPGGADYLWASSIQRRVTFADAAKDYWTFVPADWQGPGSRPRTAPLVVFMHGWVADDPKYYLDWIRHLVRKGNVIVFPRFQTSAQTPPQEFTPNAVFSIKQALAMLGKTSPVKPDTSLGMTVMAHSWGGVVGANVANRWSAESLPEPKALMLAQPYFRALDASLEGIPSTTEIACVVGDVDTTTGRTGCDLIWDRTGHVPPGNRNYLWMFNDAHGTPALSADHRAPSSGNDGAVLDALDWNGFWKLGDGLRDCGFFGTGCEYALGNTPEQTSLGTWSDGVPVRPMSVTTTKPPCPEGTLAKGC
ncbi:hypothetical protein ACFY4C_18995 [Actinomadura viridis]|uniref:hypothetical protein n=1 Tax=Actinomadura viridis TaxID=58110 RepID=UPI0036C73CFB